MLIKAVLDVFFGLVNGIVALFPQGPAPAFMTQVAPTLHTVFAGAHGMSGWIPWGLAIAVATATFGVWGVLIVVSGVRWLVGWLPTMGGS